MIKCSKCGRFIREEAEQSGCCDCYAKPLCPFFQRPCLEDLCVAFEHRPHRDIIYLDPMGCNGQTKSYRKEDPHNVCKILDIELPQVKEG